jgi:hypothetical protein
MDEGGLTSWSLARSHRTSATLLNETWPSVVIANPAQQGEAIHPLARSVLVDCFVAPLLAMTAVEGTDFFPGQTGLRPTLLNEDLS